MNGNIAEKTALFCYWPEKVYKNLCTSLKICRGTLDLLSSNLLGGKANFQLGHHIGWFTMATTKRQLFGVTGQKKCVLIYAQTRKCAQRCEVHLGLLNSNLLRAKANFLWGGHIGWSKMVATKTLLGVSGQNKVCKYWCISMKMCRWVHLGLLSSNLPRANANV